MTRLQSAGVVVTWSRNSAVIPEGIGDKCEEKRTDANLQGEIMFAGLESWSSEHSPGLS